MAQSVNADYTTAMADPYKAVDFILAIAGHPTLYSVVRGTSYAVAGDLANFTSIKDGWLDVPRGASAKTKGRPEEGPTTIGEVQCSIIDKVDGGTRAMSDLSSRFAYLLGQSTGNINQLNGNLTISATTVTVDSTTGFASSGFIYIGHECIKYTGTTGTTFTGCTRGALLTDAQAHRDNVKVYDFLPTLYRQPAYLYKGTRDLTLDKWAVAFGGVVTSEHKEGVQLHLTVDDWKWETYRDGTSVVGAPQLSPFTGDAVPPGYTTVDVDIHGFDFTTDVTVAATGNLGNGRYLVNIGGEWVAIRSAT